MITIASTGSFSRAADELQIAQPTLSKYIQKLEKNIGIELFDRSTIPIRLTTAGELYVTAGKKMIDDDRQLQKQLREVKYKQNLEIKVGISPSRAPYLMPSLLSQYQATENSGKVIIQEATVAELKERLVTGDLDLIISLTDEGTASFESVDLFDETILLAVPQVLDYHSIPEEMLLTLPHISIGRGQHMWNVMETVLHTVGGKEPVIECQSIESAMALVKQGIGAMLVPSYIRDYGLDEQNKKVRFYQLPLDQYPLLKSATKRKVSLFYRKEQFLTQAEKSFIECAKEVAKGSK
ncbi:MAG: LysR family transcriptional regulator [Syntrophomonadaceae bacterium]|nr:LysR family transcriptional regulator [Syntrophomonadaceae bacterium]